MIDWNEAPEGAQFYSVCYFRKYEDGKEYLFNDEWIRERFDSFEWHCKRSDFQIRPIQIGDVYEVVDASRASLGGKYEDGKLFTVSATKEISEEIVGYDGGWCITENDILSGYIRLVSTASTKQEENYMYGDMTDLKPAKETYKLYDQFLKNRKEVLNGKYPVAFITTENIKAHEALDRIVEIESSIQALLSERLELENLIYDVIEG